MEQYVDFCVNELRIKIDFFATFDPMKLTETSTGFKIICYTNNYLTIGKKRLLILAKDTFP